jgi:ribulose-5-phosphate 4-epimerase/fuculose-1-phosphate aldolase
MSKEAIQTILTAADYFKIQSAGYKTWGKVEFLQIAIRQPNNQYLLTDASKALSEIKENDIQLLNDTHSIFGQLFSKRKNINVILITKQEYASQVKEEIPPILDDQAQLLGVTIRVAKNDAAILHSTNNRFASILPNQQSICIGATLEDAFVAAQLLEKTSKAFVEAKVLGGAKSINKIEAWLMQKFYQFKYSKEASKNK